MAFFCPFFDKQRFLSDYEDINNLGLASNDGSHFVRQNGIRLPSPDKQQPQHKSSTTSGSADTSLSRLSGARSLGALQTIGTQGSLLPPSTLTSQKSCQSYVRTICAAQVQNFTPYCRARINTTFVPTVDDETGVEKGDFVRAIYKEEDWLYIAKSDNSEGFVPALYCQLYLNSEDAAPLSPPTPIKACQIHNRSKLDALAEKHSKRASLRSQLKTKLNKYLSKSQDFRAMNQVSKTPDPTDPSPEPTGNIRPISPKGVENVHRFLESLEASRKARENSENRDDHLSTSSTTPSDPTVVIKSTDVSQNSSVLNDNSLVGNGQKQQFATEGVFEQTRLGTCQMAYNFLARELDDVTVEKGATVTLLNVDDPDWYWVETVDHRLGFVPAVYLDLNTYERSRSSDNGSVHHHNTSCSSGNSAQLFHESVLFSPSPRSEQETDNMNMASLGQELIVKHEVLAEGAHDLTLMQNDWVYTRQSIDAHSSAWIWVHCPRLARSGFVPVAAVQRPIATVL